MAISLTPAAADRIQKFIATRGHGQGLKLGVRKTGCSGFAYVINYADQPQPQDVVFEEYGSRSSSIPRACPSSMAPRWISSSRA